MASERKRSDLEIQLSSGKQKAAPKRERENKKKEEENLHRFPINGDQWMNGRRNLETPETERKREREKKTKGKLAQSSYQWRPVSEWQVKS